MQPQTVPLKLDVASWQERSVANGPGERFVLWVQGCPFRCPGCFNPDFLPFVEQQRLTPQQVADRVLAVPGLEGITYSGGEPMAQARGLYELAQLLKPHGLTIVCYSGYTLEELCASPNRWVHRLVDCLDLLIDGRYQAELSTNLPWRGSANQRVHFLSPIYRHLEPQTQQSGQVVEMIVDRTQMVSSGILDLGFLERLEQVLREGPL